MNDISPIKIFLVHKKGTEIIEYDKKINLWIGSNAVTKYTPASELLFYLNQQSKFPKIKYMEALVSAVNSDVYYQPDKIYKMEVGI